MALSITQLFQDMQNAGGLSGSAESESSFVTAFNMMLHDLNAKTSKSISDVAQATGSVDLENYQENVAFEGTKYYLQRNGAWAQDTSGDAFALYRAAWTTAFQGKLRAASSVLTRVQPAAS
jgi:hypothetical protein